MWILSEIGFMNLTETPPDNGILIEMQSENELNQVIHLLDDIAGGEHKRIPAVQQGCCATVATKETMVAMVSKMVRAIDYSRFVQSTHINFGSDPRFILMATENGVQLSRMKPDRS